MRTSWRGLRPSWSGLRASYSWDGRTNGQTNGRTNRISPHSTGLRPLPEPLPKNDISGDDEGDRTGAASLLSYISFLDASSLLTSLFISIRPLGSNAFVKFHYPSLRPLCSCFCSIHCAAIMNYMHLCHLYLSHSHATNHCYRSRYFGQLLLSLAAIWD